MKAGGTIENTYTTSQIARISGVHPNTVRMYEKAGLIPKAIRKPNGYRIFTDIHIDQFRLARTAFRIEVLQKGLRKNIIEVVKLSAGAQYDRAIGLTNLYIKTVREEIANAKESAEIAGILLSHSQENTVFLKRKEASDSLGITMDTLRNWEMNGLLKVRRRANGYRVYSDEDMQKLKVIRSLRCANYSLSAILRMINALSEYRNIDIEQVLNTPAISEDIVSVCDKLIISLHSAEKHAEQILSMLHDMKNKYLNPPL